MASVRPPAVAGTFYPGDRETLDTEVSGYLAAVGATGPAPKAIIAPHAGYVYSGAVAAAAYARLAEARGRIERVVLVGPAHRMPFRGLAASNAEGFATPLGTVPVDAEAIERVMALPQVVVLNEAHRLEHGIEVQLPFLQQVLGEFRVVPLLAGDTTSEAVAQVLETLWGGPETLIVISSDLSHYLDYEEARRIDAETCRAIEAFEPDAIAAEQACGRLPIKGLLEIAARRGMEVTTLDMRNSGDTAGSRDRVVGYGAWVFTDPRAAAKQSDERGATRPRPGADEAAQLLGRHGGTLLRIALTSILYGLKNGRALEVDLGGHAAELGAQCASFVTLNRNGALRGCIGSPVACRPLIADVAHNGFAAAFKDPRFKPLTEAELDPLDIEVSVLSAPEPIAFSGQDALVDALRPGLDGVILTEGKHRGVFLPTVWETIPAPADFINQLKVKAGLRADHWSGDIKASRFTAAATSFSKLNSVH